MDLKIICILSVVLHFSLNQEDELLSKFHQTDYKLKEVRLELVDFDRKYVRYVHVTTFKYNRTTPAVNASCNFLINVQDKLQILVQGYKFASNEYRTFPIRFQVGLTKAWKANIFGMQDSVAKCGFVNNTYLVKNTHYYYCLGTMDQSRLPPLIPTGRYKLAVTFLYLQKAMIKLASFGEVYRPIKIPNQ